MRVRKTKCKAKNNNYFIIFKENFINLKKEKNFGFDGNSLVTTHKVTGPAGHFSVVLTFDLSFFSFS